MLWFVVNTDLTITTEKLVELFATMDDGDVRWLEDGLDLPRAKVAEMKRNYRSPSQRRDAYLDLYVTTHPCPSWRQVAKALCGVYLRHQADVVESTYVQGIRINRYVVVHYCTRYGGNGKWWGHTIQQPYSKLFCSPLSCISICVFPQNHTTLKISPHIGVKSHNMYTIVWEKFGVKNFLDVLWCPKIKYPKYFLQRNIYYQKKIAQMRA